MSGSLARVCCLRTAAPSGPFAPAARRRWAGNSTAVTAAGNTSRIIPAIIGLVPKCGHADATQWLDRQRRRLLPVPYYLVTFTVPEALRSLIRSHQKILYPELLRQSAGALADVARAHKDLGAELGLLAVLQTWTRDLRYHPHVHCVVPGGGARRRWPALGPAQDA